MSDLREQSTPLDTPPPTARKPTVLDGPMGTRLAALGLDTRGPGWSLHALRTHPEAVARVHGEYARAGATVHTSNTFRTRPRTAPEDWASLAREAVGRCRAAVPPHHRVAGSLAPIHDCYRPDLAPRDSRDRHRALAEVLVDAGVDLVLCETHPSPREALHAVQGAAAAGSPEIWLALTGGPDGALLSPTALAEAARRCVDHGAEAVLVNCVAASKTLPYVQALVAADLGVPVGAYANAGAPDEGIGWDALPDAEAYVRHARRWVDAGATLVGACCGCGPAHIHALNQHFHGMISP